MKTPHDHLVPGIPLHSMIQLKAGQACNAVVIPSKAGDQGRLNSSRLTNGRSCDSDFASKLSDKKGERR